MKKPLLNLEERESIRLDTYAGAFLRLHLAFKRMEKETYKEYGCLIARKKIKQLVKHIDQILFNR